MTCLRKNLYNFNCNSLIGARVSVSVISYLKKNLIVPADFYF